MLTTALRATAKSRRALCRAFDVRNMIKEIFLRHKFAVGFLCGLSVIPILMVIFWFLAFGRHTVFWQSYQTDIPETKSQLVFHWKAIHPFLAEYDRKVQLISGSRRSQQYWLQTNTGGRHHLNFYLIEAENEKWLRLLDRYSEFVINLDTLQGYSVGRMSGKTFIGPPAKEANWGYFWMGGADKIEAIIGEAKGTYDPRFEKPGKFLGTLDARSGMPRFVPTSEKPEEHIMTQDEQAAEMNKSVEPATAQDAKQQAPVSF